ncbi:MAG: 6-phosphofructokinase [Clostridia bacterium]|nr:6-phosphofructokinase [Clostridia bacterium]
MKKIGVLTSGGDAPGMNAAVRAVVRTACYLGMEVVGVRYGYKGLLEEDFIELNMRNVCDIIHRGGTKIYTARCPEFRGEEAVRKAVDVAKKNGIEGLVVVGGDGSFRGARDLSNFGLPCVAIPGTIDNDIVCTDYTIGFDTCLNTVQALVDRLRDTIESHSRCMVVEVMGARAGYLTLNAGIAVGATAILIPEIPYDIEKNVIEKIRRTASTGKHHFIVMVAEGVRFRDGITVDEIAKKIEEETGVEARSIVLGHIQRGGSPSVRDRVVASQMGHKAVHLLHEGKSNRVVVMHGETITDHDINEALEMSKTIDKDLYNCAMEISL